MGAELRILVVGAGGIGGYFGGRLLEAKRNVTFLVRPARAAELSHAGLSIRSRFGNVDLANPPTVTSDRLDEPYDLVLLSCKAYDLDDAMRSFARAVGPNTAILPLLNGLRHITILRERFGDPQVLGGQCVISVTVAPDRQIEHLNDKHLLSFGELDGSHSERIERVASALSGARFDAHLSNAILQEMWSKWVFIAAAAGITCLMRASIGDIVAANAADFPSQLLDECGAIAAAEGFPIPEAPAAQSRASLTQPGSTLTASMFRDIQSQRRIEADHVVGDLLRRGEEHDILTPLLRTAYAHLNVYEARLARESRD